MADTAMSRWIFLNSEGLWERERVTCEPDEWTLYELDEFCDIQGERRWWNVRHAEGGGRALCEISEEEGRRAQAFIESPEWDMKNKQGA